MRLSNREFRAMNNPVRRFFQRRVEFPTFRRMGLEAGGKDVLEIGCGSGYGAVLLSSLQPRSYIGIDLMAEQIELARRIELPGAVFHIMDATDLAAFEDASKDLVVIFGILHHIPRWPQVIKEARRVLRTGGEIFLEEPSEVHDPPLGSPVQVGAPSGRAIRARRARVRAGVRRFRPRAAKETPLLRLLPRRGPLRAGTASLGGSALAATGPAVAAALAKAATLSVAAATATGRPYPGAFCTSRTAFLSIQAPVPVGIVLLEVRLVVALALFVGGGAFVVADLAVTVRVPAVQAPFLPASVVAVLCFRLARSGALFLTDLAVTVGVPALQPATPRGRRGALRPESLPSASAS